MAQGKVGHEEQLWRSLVHLTPSACSWAPQKESLTSSSCAFSVLLSWETSCDLAVSTRISAPSLPIGLCRGFPSASALQVHPELLLGHFLPHPTKIRTILFSCLASGEEQDPAERIFNSLYSTPQCVNSGLPGSLLHPSPLLLSIPLQKISGF